MQAISPANTIFVLLSFEGPDRYSLAGGLGMRVSELSRALAEAGYRTHVVFVGDPHAPASEARCGGRLRLHRWCQWISKYYRGGVYHGEEEKLADFTASAPSFVAHRLVRPAIEAGQMAVILGEEWHTAEAMCHVSDLLHEAGVRTHAVLLWNANNTMGFHRINWPRLAFTTTITTVSRYMKHLMWGRGINPLVIPNGIPRRLLQPVDAGAVAQLRQSLRKPVLLTKVGRWDPDKRWLMAVETVARLRTRGCDVVLLARGGVEPHEREVLEHARSLGLRVENVAVAEQSLLGYLRAFAEAGPADVLNIKSFVPLEFLRLIYVASDAVLAHSGREPFGLVALEAMASGAITFTGATGEDYAIHLENGVVLETEDPEEAAWYVRFLGAHPAVAARLRRGARHTARRFLWARVVDSLVSRAEFIGMRQGVLTAGERALPRAFDALVEEVHAEPECPAAEPEPVAVG